MSTSYHIRQLVPRGTAVFFFKRLILLENGKKLSSSCFHCVTNTHQDNISSGILVSVDEWLGLQVTFLL